MKEEEYKFKRDLLQSAKKSTESIEKVVVVLELIAERLDSLVNAIVKLRVRY